VANINQPREAEMALLGSAFLDNGVMEEILDLQPDMFAPGNAKIYLAMKELYIHNEPIDLITLQEKLGSDISAVGGVQYLTDLMNYTPTTANTKYYAEIIKKNYTNNRVTRALYRGIEIVQKKEGDVFEFLDKELSELQKNYIRQDIYSAEEVAIKVAYDLLENMGKNTLPGVPWGFKELDIKTGGMMPGDLVIIGARPSMGKTSFALEIARHTALELGLPVGIFELEMRKEQLIRRLACMESEVDGNKVKFYAIEKGSRDEKKLFTALQRIKNSKILIDDTSGITVAELMTKARKMKRQYPDMPLIIVDYLQLMSGSGNSRREIVEENTRRLKELAKDLDVTMLVLSQLSRAPEGRSSEDKRPVLSDLRETGAIEQDADMVAFLYREDYYDEDTENKGVAELIIRKQRDGELGTVRLGWIANYTKFVELGKLERYREE